MFLFMPRWACLLNLAHTFEGAFEKLKFPFLQTAQITTHSDPSFIIWPRVQGTYLTSLGLCVLTCKMMVNDTLIAALQRGLNEIFREVPGK